MAKGPGKGITNNPNGRPKGVPNATTKEAREAIARFVDSNVGRFTDWIDTIAQDDPAKAMDLIIKVMEYHLPKLQRAEVTGEDGGPIQISGVNLKLIRPDDKDA